MPPNRICGSNIDETAVLCAIELSTEKFCPVQSMLGKAFPMRLIYRIFNEDAKTLLKEGQYIQKQAGYSPVCFCNWMHSLYG